MFVLDCSKDLLNLLNEILTLHKPFFDKSPCTNICDGTAALSYAEFLHRRKNFSKTKKIYNCLIKEATKLKESDNAYLGGVNINIEWLTIQAMCDLGQLESYLCNYNNAEKHFMTTLTKA